MFENNLHIADIIRKSLAGSEVHQKQLDRWLDSDPGNRNIYESVMRDLGRNMDRYDEYRAISDFDDLKDRIGKRGGQRGGQRDGQRDGQRKRRFISIAAAAVFIPLLIYGGFLIGTKPSRQIPENIFTHNSSGVRLVQQDGSEMELPDVEGTVPYSKVRRKDDGKLILSYRIPDSDFAAVSTDAVLYNKIIVPRGCDYVLELSDGTIVYLNADTEIEYPVRFTGGTREVKLRGQAYFDIARDESQPFIVKTTRSEIHVLGTEFDVMDYEGRPNLTTLVKGSLEVRDSDGNTRLIAPGQQAEISAGGIETRDVHTLHYTVWKDGYFMFHDMTVGEIMDELAYWYDMEYIINDPSLKEMKLTAKLKKYDSVSQILDVLSKLKELEFVFDGRRIIVR